MLASPPPRSRRTPDLARENRLRRILDAATAEPSFEAAALRERLSEHPPGNVTRLLNELVAAGWLLEAEGEGESGFEARADASSVRDAAPPAARRRGSVRRGSAKRRLRWNTARGPFDADAWLAHRLAGDRIAEQPEKERPRERLLDAGAAALSNAELMAILVRSGRPGESAVTAGQKLARRYGDRLPSLTTAGRAELKEVSRAVDVTAYCAILAGIELGRRVAAAAEADPGTALTGTSSAVAFCRHRFARLAADGVQEEFHIVTLDTRHHILNTHRITVGTLDASLVHPREVFRPAIRDAAAAVLLVHNHPSGDPSPSPEDHAVTRRLESAGRTLGIDVLDHIVVASRGAKSLRSAG